MSAYIFEQIINFMLIIYFALNVIGAIQTLFRAEVKIASRFLFGPYRLRYLHGKPAYVYGACNLIGSSIVLAYILSYSVFAVALDIKVVLLPICGLALVFYAISGIIVQKYGETS